MILGSQIFRARFRLLEPLIHRYMAERPKHISFSTHWTDKGSVIDFGEAYQRGIYMRQKDASCQEATANEFRSNIQRPIAINHQQYVIKMW